MDREMTGTANQMETCRGVDAKNKMVIRWQRKRCDELVLASLLVLGSSRITTLEAPHRPARG
jgi:hypothetical protein